MQRYLDKNIVTGRELREDHKKSVNDNWWLFEYGEKFGCPAELLASVVCREHNCNIDNPRNGDGFIQNTYNKGSFGRCYEYGIHSEDCARVQIEWSCKHLQGKVGNKLTKDTKDPMLLMDALYGYNGRWCGEDPRCSPYVVNNIDEWHTDMKFCFDGKCIQDKRDGAFTTMIKIKLMKGI